MAQHPVEDLLEQQSLAKIAQIPKPQMVKDKKQAIDVRDWAMNAPIPWSAMFVGGVSLATLGAVLGIFATIFTTGLLVPAIAAGLLTVGGGFAFLGGYKRVQTSRNEGLKSLPAENPKIVEERSRRISQILANSGQPYTFERLFETLRWTRAALISTLIYMKEKDQVIEDLDLDTGEWVYTVLRGPKT